MAATTSWWSSCLRNRRSTRRSTAHCAWWMGRPGRSWTPTVDRDLRRLYQLRLERQLRELERFCRRRGVEYLRASTAIGFEDVVLKYLRHGAHLR